MKESEKIDKYLDLARELKKKMWDSRMRVILIVVGALGKEIGEIEEESRPSRLHHYRDQLEY